MKKVLLSGGTFFLVESFLKEVRLFFESGLRVFGKSVGMLVFDL